MDFAIGTHVRKPKGYAFDSVIVASFEKLDGEKRIVCESKAIPGLLHIFSPTQIVADRRRQEGGTE